MAGVAAPAVSVVTKRVLAVVLGSLVGLALAEGAARLLESRASGLLVDDIGERVDDPLLEYRTLPGSGQNDAAGYRNRERPDRVDVVALGDSQTWGVNADIDDTWPARLAEIADLSVYNMGRGGYGIVQYRHQLEEALALAPSTVVIALYFGNDVYDAYSLAYGLEAHAALRHPDAGLRRRIVESDYPELQRMFFERVNHGREAPASPGWLSRHSALARMFARSGNDPVDAERDRAWAQAHPEEGFVYDDGRLSTVFHTRYRLAALDSRLPRIREGLRITLAVLDDLQQRIRAFPDTRLLIVLIPTKERIFAQAVEAGGVAGDPPDDYWRGVREERRISAGLAGRMDRLGLRYLDLLPVLQQSVSEGEAIFPPNADGHFTPLGYERIAQAIAASMTQNPARTDAR